MSTQRLSLRYEVPVPAPGTGTEVKYADSEDYFKAGPAYDKPDDMPPSVWESFKARIYTVVFMGIPTGFTWLTAGLAFGDVTGLLAKLQNQELNWLQRRADGTHQ